MVGHRLDIRSKIWHSYQINPFGIAIHKKNNGPEVQARREGGRATSITNKGITA